MHRIKRCRHCLSMRVITGIYAKRYRVESEMSNLQINQKRARFRGFFSLPEGKSYPENHGERSSTLDRFIRPADEAAELNDIAKSVSKVFAEKRGYPLRDFSRYHESRICHF